MPFQQLASLLDSFLHKSPSVKSIFKKNCFSDVDQRIAQFRKTALYVHVLKPHLNLFPEIARDMDEDLERIETLKREVLAEMDREDFELDSLKLKSSFAELEKTSTKFARDDSGENHYLTRLNSAIENFFHCECNSNVPVKANENNLYSEREVVQMFNGGGWLHYMKQIRPYQSDVKVYVSVPQTNLVRQSIEDFQLPTTPVGYVLIIEVEVSGKIVFTVQIEFTAAQVERRLNANRRPARDTYNAEQTRVASNPLPARQLPEYRFEIQPVQEFIADNRNINFEIENPENGIAECYDLIELDSRRSVEHLNEDPQENIVVGFFSVGQPFLVQSLCTTRQDLIDFTRQLENRFVACKEEYVGRGVDRDSVVIKIPVASGHAYVPEKDLDYCLNLEGRKVWGLVDQFVNGAPLQMRFTASEATIAGGSFVSADHCQAGTSKRIHRMVPMEVR